MKSSTQEIQNIVEECCKESIGFFLEQVPLQRANFPIIELTYTLWRKYAYKKIQQRTKEYENAKQKIDKCFFITSQKRYLPKFIQKVKAQMNTFCRGVKKIQQSLNKNQKMPKKEQQVYEMIIQLGKTVWDQQLYIELIQDIINLPYLSVIPPNSSIIVKPEFETDYIFQRRQKNVIKTAANNAGKKIFNKILTSVAEAMFSKTSLLRINTLLGSFNPLVIGASFGLSRYLQHLDKKRKDQQFGVQLAKALEQSKNKVEKVCEIYERCLDLVVEIVNTEQVNSKQLREKLKQTFLLVFEEEWLRIQVIKEEDGWEVVKMEEKESFQQL